MAIQGSYGPTAVATGPTTVITAPATERYTNVTILVNNPTAAAISFTASIGADAAGTRIIGTNTVANIPANTPKMFYNVGSIPPSTVMTLSAGGAGLNCHVTYTRQLV